MENKLTVTKGKQGGIKEELWIDRYTALHIKKINNKNLLYSTENYTQYPGINHNGKE